MNCSPTLTADEFKTLHNGLWELDCMVSKLLHGNVYEGQKLEQIARTLRDSLKGAYEQDHKAFETKSDHYDQVRKQMGLKTTWSIYEIDNMADHHRFGPDVDRVVYRDHWGDEPVQASIQGSTWAALYAAADHCIRNSGDSHHVFIEDFRPAKDDPRTLILQTGS